jgi:hypothetical protein
LTALTREIVQGMIGNGYEDVDFGAAIAQTRVSGSNYVKEKHA